MDSESIHDLIFGYALDALDEDDMQMFEEHLASCAECHAAMPELRLTVAELGERVEPVSPRARLRRQIVRRVRRDPR
jgi:anti-sigma factor RsiW